MRLSNQPPAGAGRVQHVTLTDKLLKVIDGLGNDRFGNPVGIRSPALAEATGVPAKSITALLASAVARGRVVVCKITTPGGVMQNEYRQGVGVPPPEFKPLNTKRNDLACSLPAARRVPGAEVATGTLAPRTAETATPVFLSKPTPQPAVGTTTPAAGTLTPPQAAPAVAAQATPKPDARATLKKEPAAPKASAGDVTITIDATGVLVIGTDEGVIELQPNQCKRLGHFLIGSQGIWNPF